MNEKLKNKIGKERGERRRAGPQASDPQEGAAQRRSRTFSLQQPPKETLAGCTSAGLRARAPRGLALPGWTRECTCHRGRSRELVHCSGKVSTELPRLGDRHVLCFDGCTAKNMS